MAMCTCGSEIKCPHDISSQLDSASEELEAMVDRMLSNFKKSMLHEYLDTINPSAIPGTGAQGKVTSTASSSSGINKHRSKISLRGSAATEDLNLPKLAALRSKLSSRPKTADPIGQPIDGSLYRPSVAWGVSEMSEAQHSPPKKMKKSPSQKEKKSKSTSSQLSQQQTHGGDDWSELGGPELLSDLPIQTSIPLCLHHIVDAFIRKVLPWQSFLCRRAIESLRDLRIQKMNSIYENLLTNMSKKLSDKVQQFLQTKQTEIRDWGTNEIKTWNQQLTDLIASLEKSLVDDSQRQLQRDQLHAQAQAWRDLNLTNSIEEIEKETTRKQIQEAKRLCNTEKAIDSRMLQVTLSSAHARAGAQQIVLDRSILKKHESAHEWLCCVADNAITASLIENQMKLILKQFQKEKKKVLEQFHQTKVLYDEQCELMLRSIEQYAEMVTNQAHDHIHRERLLYQGFLFYLLDLQCHQSHGTYRGQGSGSGNGGNGGGVSAGNGGMGGGKSGHERGRGLGNGHGASHGNGNGSGGSGGHVYLIDHQNETTQLYIRHDKQLKSFLKRRFIQLKKFNEHKTHLCLQLTQHYREATSAIFNNIRHREEMIELYIQNINQLYRKYVQISCNRRRLLLTNSLYLRKKYFYYEDECLTEISSLLTNLRYEMDGIWRKEYLISLYFIQSFNNNLDYNEKNYIKKMSDAWNSLSCNLLVEGEQSNIAWVGETENLLKLKYQERKFALKQFHRKIDLEWATLLFSGVEEMKRIFSKLTSLLSEVNYDELIRQQQQQQQQQTSFAGAGTGALTKEDDGAGGQGAGAAGGQGGGGGGRGQRTGGDAFEQIFQSLELEINEVINQLTFHQQNRSEKEQSILQFTLQTQQDFIEKTWKENILLMNSTLLNELKQFFDIYCVSKDEFHDLFLQNEIEMNVSEQKALFHFEEFWKQIYQKNKIFSNELMNTLLSIILYSEKKNTLVNNTRHSTHNSRNSGNDGQVMSGNTESSSHGGRGRGRGTSSESLPYNDDPTHFILFHHLQQQQRVGDRTGEPGGDKERGRDRESKVIAPAVEDLPPLNGNPHRRRHGNGKEEEDGYENHEGYNRDHFGSVTFSVDHIDFERLFSSSRFNPSPNPPPSTVHSSSKATAASISPSLDTPPQAPPQPAAPQGPPLAYIECIHLTLASLPSSRIRHFLNHLKNELRSLPTTSLSHDMKPTLSSPFQAFFCDSLPSQYDPSVPLNLHSFNQLIMTTNTATQHHRDRSTGTQPHYSTSINQTFSCLQIQIQNFISTSKLILTFIQLLSQPQPQSHNSATTSTSSGSISNSTLTLLEYSFSISLASQLLSSVSVYSQRVDIFQVHEYLRQNIKQLTASSLHLIGFLISDEKILIPLPLPFSSSSTSSSAAASDENNPHINVSPTPLASTNLPDTTGLSEMLCTESSWMISTLGLDEDFPSFGENPATDYVSATTHQINLDYPSSFTSAASASGSASTSTSPHQLSLLSLFDQHRRYQETDKPGNSNSNTRNGGTYTATPTFLSKLFESMVPDHDLCVFLGFLNDDTLVNDQIIDTSIATLQMVTRLWRLIAFCRLHFLALHSEYILKEEIFPNHETTSASSSSSSSTLASPPIPTHRSAHRQDLDTFEIILRHYDSFIQQSLPSLDNGELQIYCRSPFQNIQILILFFAKISNFSFSFLQILCFLSNSSGFLSDPWITDPNLYLKTMQIQMLSQNYSDFILNHLLWGYWKQYQPSRALSHSHSRPHSSSTSRPHSNSYSHPYPSSPSRYPYHSTVSLFPLLSRDCYEKILHLNSGNPSQPIPYESLREYCDKHLDTNGSDNDSGSGVTFNQTQLTMRFWCAFHDKMITDQSTHNGSSSEAHRTQTASPTRTHKALKSTRGAAAEVTRAGEDDPDSPFPSGLLESLPLPSEESKVDYAYRSSTSASTNAQSVIEMLDIGDAVDSFTDTLGDISDPSSSFLSSNYSEIVGILTQPMDPQVRRQTLIQSLENELAIHQPIQSNITLWYHSAVSLDINSILALQHSQPRSRSQSLQPQKQSYSFASPLRPSSSPSKGRAQAHGQRRVEHYPSPSEIKKQIELLLLFQYSDDINISSSPSSSGPSVGLSPAMDQFSKKSRTIALISPPLPLHSPSGSGATGSSGGGVQGGVGGTVGGGTEATEAAGGGATGGATGGGGGMSEYWRHLSYNRLIRIKDFVQNIRSVMSDNWSEMIYSHRIDRYTHHATLILNNFHQFKDYLTNYRHETLKQRVVLKTLYTNLTQKISDRAVLDQQQTGETAEIFQLNLKEFQTSLKSIFKGYQLSKKSFLHSNWSVFVRKKLCVEEIQRECYQKIKESCEIQNNEYRIVHIGKHFDQVKASNSAGYQRYQATTDSLAQIKNKFLTTLSKSWKEVNDEVTKSVLHFEYLLSDLLMRWYDTEKVFQQSIKEDKTHFLTVSVTESVEEIMSQHKENSGKVLEFYHNLESTLVLEYFEPYNLLPSNHNSRNNNNPLHSLLTAEQHDHSLLISRTPSNVSIVTTTAAAAATTGTGTGIGTGAESPSKPLHLQSHHSHQTSSTPIRMSRRSSREPLAISRQNSFSRGGAIGGGGTGGGSPILRFSSHDSDTPSSLRQSPFQDTSTAPAVPHINPTSSSTNLLTPLPRSNSHSHPLSHSHPSWIKLHDKFHLYIVTIAKQFKSNRSQMIHLIQTNRQKRRLSIELLEQKALEIRMTWETIRSNLIQMMDRYVIEAREQHSLLSVNLLELTTQYRSKELQRLHNFRATITPDIYTAFQRTLLSSDDLDRELFEEYDDRVEDVLVATNKEINEVDHQPIPLRSFLREIETAPMNFLDAMRSKAFQFYERYHPSPLAPTSDPPGAPISAPAGGRTSVSIDRTNTSMSSVDDDDQIIYQFHQTSEVLTLCLDHLRKVCQGIMDDYVRDKRETYKKLHAISKCEVMLDCRPQVSSVLDMMINTIEAEEVIRHELNEQTKTITTRNRSLDQTRDKFLAANTLPVSFYDSNNMLPNEEDLLEIYGPCKLHTNLHHHHGICNHCIATLLSTITRNNTIVSAKLEALATHLMVMRAREDEIDKGCYLQLFDKYDQLQEIILKDIADQRLKILSKFHDRCRERDPLYQPLPPHTSSNNGNGASDGGISLSPLQLLNQLVERTIFQEICSSSSNEPGDANEVIALLMRKANLSMKEEPQHSQPQSVQQKLEPSSKSAFGDSSKSLTISTPAANEPQSHLQTILSLSPSHTMDESELPSHSSLSFLQPSPSDPTAQRKHVKVPLLPLKESIPQQENEYLILPYGWEERPVSVTPGAGGEGDVCFVNIHTGEVLPFDIHPTFLMANYWRKCYLTEAGDGQGTGAEAGEEEEGGEEFYFNDLTGETTWVAPLEAFAEVTGTEDEDRVCCVSSDVAREYDEFILKTIKRLEQAQAQELIRNRPPPPVPKTRRALQPKIAEARVGEGVKQEKGPSAFSTVREKNYSIDVVDGDEEEEEAEGNQSFESAGDLSYDALYALTVTPEQQQQREQQRAEEEEERVAVFDTLTHLYSSQGPVAGEGERERERKEYGDNISALGDSFAASHQHQRYELVTGYSSNDGDGDTATELEQEPEEESDHGDGSGHTRGNGFGHDSPQDSFQEEHQREEKPEEEGEGYSSEFTETMATNSELIGEAVAEEENTREEATALLFDPYPEEDPFASNPDSWVLRRDEQSGLNYFENTISGETTWETPSALSPAAPAGTLPVSASAVAAAPAPASDPTAWQIYFTDTGIPYYFNSSTGESQWTTPADLQHSNPTDGPEAEQTEKLGQDQLLIRSNSGASYLADLTPIHSHREGSNRRSDVFSLLGGGADGAGAAAAGEEEENDDNPYLIDLMDFTPKGARVGRKISDLL